MTGQHFVALVVCIALGVTLGLLLARQLITWQHVLCFVIGFICGLILAQVQPFRRMLSQHDHATDKCLLSAVRMTQCGPAARRGGCIFLISPGELT